MKQFNHWKLSQLQKIITKIVLWGFGLVLLLLDMILKQAINFNMVSKIVGIISILLGLSLHFVERVLWKTKLLAFPFFEEYWTPVLEGRWEGTLTRDGEVRPFVIEIRQSFNSISCVTYSETSSSSSYAAELLYDERTKMYKLIYYWQAKTSNVQEGTGDTNIFDGFTVIDIVIASQKVIKLTGSYFTNRQPKQTKGELFLDSYQKTLKNSFK